MKQLFFFCCLITACNLYGDLLEDFSLRGSVIEVEEISRRVPLSMEFEEGLGLSGRRLVFDHEGRLQKEEWAGQDGGYSTRIELFYDPNGHLLEKIFFQKGMTVPDRTVYSRDGDDRLSEIIHTFTVGTYGWIYRHDYDSEGRLREKRKFELYGTPISIIRYYYDDADRVTEERSLDFRGRVCSYVRYTYSSRTITREFAPEGTDIRSITRTTRNGFGDPRKIVSELASGKVLYTRNFEYIYDGHGNWTERIEKDSGRDGVLVTRRSLRYDETASEEDG